MESRDQDPAAPQAGEPAGEPPTPEPPATEPPTTEPPATERPTTAAPATEAPAGGAPPHEPPAGDPPPTGAASTGGAADAPRRLYRSRDDRMVAGVCGGLARYFGIDPVIVRVAAVALVFAGGAGLLAYLAAWLLVPDEAAAAGRGPGRTATVAGAVLLVFAVTTIVPFWGGPFGGNWGGPFAGLLCLALLGLGVWWLASGEHPAGSARDVLRRAGLGLAILALCGILAVGAAWATAVGGGTVVAVVVIVAGVWVAAGAVLGGTRWLILPALALALPAGVVSAANIDVDGGIGDRQYRPAAATAVHPVYRLGVGRLVVDLRNADLGAGDRRIDLKLGIGEAVVAVDPGVCVTTHARIGAGEVGVFDRTSGGIDVDWQDDRTALSRTPRVVIDANIGVGALRVTQDDPQAVSGHDFGTTAADGGNDACVGGRNG
jgi:phage shock protein PspC (stress-responsive transcriptional regulator)